MLGLYGIENRLAMGAGIQINILLSNILQQYIDIANININIGFSSSSNI